MKFWADRRKSCPPFSFWHKFTGFCPAFVKRFIMIFAIFSPIPLNALFLTFDNVPTLQNGGQEYESYRGAQSGTDGGIYQL